MTDSASARVIAVVGATGAQGGGLVRAILDHPDDGLVARAITRNPGSDAARALADQGVEVVQADLNDVESVVSAFEGAYGAYCVTNFWELFDGDKEQQQAANMATAAARAGIRHAIWSSLEDTRLWVPLDDDRMPTLGDRYKVPHYDIKGSAEHFFTDEGVPTTFLMTSFYWENMIYFGLGPKPGPDGALHLTLPIGAAALPGIAAKDIGASAQRIFVEGPPSVSNRIGIAGAHLTGEQMAQSLQNALGQPVSFSPVTAEVFRSWGFPGAEDLGNMFQFLEEFNADVTASHPVEASHARVPDMQDFDQWLAENAGRIPLD